MLPPAAEATEVQAGPWTVPAAQIVDRPRFAYRGTMLDVARHFFSVDDVLRHIDLISLYKVNVCTCTSWTTKAGASPSRAGRSSPR